MIKNINNTRTFFLKYNRKRIISTLTSVLNTIIINNENSIWLIGKRIVVNKNFKSSYLDSIYGNVKRVRLSLKTIVSYRNYLLISKNMISINKWSKMREQIDPDFFKEISHSKMPMGKVLHLRKEYKKRKKTNTLFISADMQFINEKIKNVVEKSKLKFYTGGVRDRYEYGEGYGYGEDGEDR